jgi:alpha-galactosidase/6-phospho-beta-glucosidase family protein
MNEKIVIIGAGRTVFTRRLVAGLICAGWRAALALVDIDPHALGIARRLVEKMMATTKAPIKLQASTESSEELLNATAVICTIGVSKRRAWEQNAYVLHR